jgi:hypothetical protein
MANQVTLTFAGESTNLEQTFDRVGESSKRVGEHAKEAGDGFSKAGEAADEVDTKAMGFRDTLTGVQDSMSGLAMLSKGPSFEGFLTLGAGIGDLGSGFYNFLIPALEKTKLATVASTVASKAAAIGTKAWAAAQWLMSGALWASPITWIVVAIIALIAVIVLIATKTDWFQRAWRASWRWIKDAASDVWEWLKKVPGWIGHAFSKVADFLTAPFRAAFNFIARAWNNTVGGLSWSVPSWVPFIGGNSISVPHLRTFDVGGYVPGHPGTPVLAMLQAGERVQPRTSSGSGGVLRLGSDGTRMGDWILDVIADAMRGRGGDPAQLGIELG